MSERQKTGSPTNAPLMPQALKIIKKYQEHPICIQTEKSLLKGMSKALAINFKLFSKVLTLPLLILLKADTSKSQSMASCA